jgi:hypothetical protein
VFPSRRDLGEAHRFRYEDFRPRQRSRLRLSRQPSRPRLCSFRPTTAVLTGRTQHSHPTRMCRSTRHLNPARRCMHVEPRPGPDTGHCAYSYGWTHQCGACSLKNTQSGRGAHSFDSSHSTACQGRGLKHKPERAFHVAHRRRACPASRLARSIRSRSRRHNRASATRRRQR